MKTPSPEISKSFNVYDASIPALAVADLSLDEARAYSPHGVDLSNSPTYWVARVSVPVSMRKKGIGKALMTQVCEWLDANSFNAVIGVSSYGDMSNDELQSFYAGFGFIFDGNRLGYRTPKQFT